MINCGVKGRKDIFICLYVSIIKIMCHNTCGYTILGFYA